MASSPTWKVYSDTGEYVAACKYVFDAAMIVAGRGVNGTTIRAGHRFIMWTEGKEAFSASESYDGVAEVVRKRNESRWRAIEAAARGKE